MRSNIAKGVVTALLLGATLHANAIPMLRLTGSQGGGGTTTTGHVSYTVYYDAGTTALAKTNELANLGIFSPGAFSAEAGGMFLAPALYSLTLWVTIYHEGNEKFELSSFDSVVRVPEPGSLLLLSLGMLVIGIVVARRRRQNKAK